MSQPAVPLLQLAKYELLAEIGHGGMATVYRALDKRLGREVAVKVIHRHLRESSEVARRFTAEARAVAKLKHPNIVEIYDVSDDDAPERYLTAELVRGKSLRAVLTAQGSLPPEIAATIGAELASALAHAHERGVVHRDVKPENVLFGLPDGDERSTDKGADEQLVSVKLTDFGIAKMLDQQGVTVTGQVLGSPAYMAPEQIECGNVDERSDIFALGVLLYECMVGHLPFEGKNPAQVLRRVLEGSFVPADREVPQIGARWSEIISRSLSQRAEDRPSTMLALRAALLSELDALGIHDLRAELTEYFVDPDDYAARLPSRIAPVLLSRGLAAQRADKPIEAAGCLNRALALAPADPQIIAAVASLTRSRSLETLRRRALRGLLFVAVCSLVAIVAGKIVPMGRTTPQVAMGWAPPPWVTSASERLSASASAPVPGVVEAPPPASASAAPVGSGGHKLATPVQGPAAEVGRKTAQVNFIVLPKSARVIIDGKYELQQDVAMSLQLEVGVTHYLSARVEGDGCCGEIIRRPFEVPAMALKQPWTYSTKLPLNRAKLQFKGPAGWRLECREAQVLPDETVPIVISEFEGKTIECTVTDGAKVIRSERVKLLPGKLSTVVGRGA